MAITRTSATQHGRARAVLTLAGVLATASCSKHEQPAKDTGIAPRAEISRHAGTAARPPLGTTTTDAATDDARTTNAERATDPRAMFVGHATGTSAEPPIRAFVPNFQVASWSGSGNVGLELPEGDGRVAGTLRVGDMSFRVRGYKSGPHVRATLDQEAPPDTSNVSDAAAPDLFSGTLDADLSGALLRGTWEASAQGGRLRRRGTVEARRR